MHSPPPPTTPTTAPDRSSASHDAALALRTSAKALGRFYRTVFPEVLRLSRGFLADRAVAEDVAQDVMLRLADSIDRWDPTRPFLAWTRVATLNACRNQLRASERRTDHEAKAGRLRAVKGAPSPSAAAEASESTELLNRALGLLPAREREVFVLVDLEGLDSREAAELCEVSPSTVRAALAQARRRLRDALAPELNGEGGHHEPRI